MMYDFKDSQHLPLCSMALLIKFLEMVFSKVHRENKILALPLTEQRIKDEKTQFVLLKFQNSFLPWLLLKNKNQLF